MNVTQAVDLYQKIIAEVSRVIIGKQAVKQTLMLALIAGGHVLIEGPPGSAKTTISKSFAEAIGGNYQRVQFTPDMMPADITGFYLYSTEGKPNFIEGPVFANIVLADELNRTTPRTQSALLEAMQEHQVTIERKTFPLPQPFMVVATQVRAGGEGTYPLTDVQVDRFLLHVLSEYPSMEEERQVINGIDRIDSPEIKQVTNPAEIISIQALARQVQVSPEVSEYIIALVDRLRHDPDVLAGPSTRGSIALYKCARAMALFDGRDYVIPDDVKNLVFTALEHRFQVKPEAEMDNITPHLILEKVIEQIPVPRLII